MNKRNCILETVKKFVNFNSKVDLTDHVSYKILENGKQSDYTIIIETDGFGDTNKLLADRSWVARVTKNLDEKYEICTFSRKFEKGRVILNTLDLSID